MKLLALRVAAFRRFARTGRRRGVSVTASTFSPGRTRWASRRSFTRSKLRFSTRYKVTGAALDDMRPHAGGEPLVEVEFEAQGRRWSIRKQFGRGASAVLTDVSTGQRRRSQRRS